MPLSSKTKNLLDLYADLAESKKLERHDTDTLMAGAVYAMSRDLWGPLAKLATELATRTNGTH